MTNVVGKIPEFPDEGTQEEKEVKPLETETPSEPSTEEKPVEPESEPAPEQPAPEPEPEPKPDEDTGKEELAIDSLTERRNKLLEEIRDLRGQRRDEKEKPILIDKPIEDELKDINPDDLKVIEKVLKAKGYVQKVELDKQLYQGTQKDVLNTFLDKYPEYKPENDPKNVNWDILQEELKDYKMPTDPRQTMRILEKARKAISTTVPTSGKEIETQKAQVKTASIGAGGKTPQPSQAKSLDPSQREALRRGGFGDEEINDMLK